jgi:hypothetical protein
MTAGRNVADGRKNMKKTVKRLVLTKETLRSLNETSLLEALGGQKSGDGGFGTICSDCAPNTWHCV